jgi:hypothetical protein
VRDDFATTLTVPSAVKLTKTTLTEATLTCASTNFTKCASLDLQIVDVENTTSAFNFSPNYLTIVLRMDKENILTNNIRSVVLTYKYFDADNVEQTHIIGDCANATTPRADGLPCIAASKYYRTVKKTDDPALLGDFEWSLISLKNGRFNIE